MEKSTISSKKVIFNGVRFLKAAQEEQKSEKKSCCSSDSTAKSEEKEHGHCGKKKQNFEEMKAWMQDYGKDYYPVFFLEAKSFEVME